MRIDLRDIINIPGNSVTFDFEPDLSDAVTGCVKAVKKPARAKGIIRNSAGIVHVEADVDAVLECACSRCLRDFEQPVHLHIDTTVADLDEDSGDPDVYPLDGDSADMSEIVATEFVLRTDDAPMCRDDCKGLCQQCGADLNEGPCSCKKDTDPRLAALGQLLENE